MVPPSIHRLLTACGIRDASATIEGSRNAVEVIKCAIQILHGGVSLRLI
jgi:small subunit ribosomal protein S5